MVNDVKLYYEDVVKRDPMATISVSYGISRPILEEVFYITENDTRFVRSYKANAPDLHDYDKIASHLKSVWNFEIQPRQIKYIYRIKKLHDELLDKLERGGYMRDTYSNLVYKKA